MPVLTNHRQEAFCQLVKQRIPKLHAYRLAGYVPNNGAPYRLAETVRVKARITELTKGMAMKAQVTVQSITEELEEARLLAAKIDQPSAMATATVAKAKLHGLMVERQERGEPGAFGDSTETVLARVAAELGADAAADLARALERTPEAPPPPAPTDNLPLPPASTNDGTGTLN